MNASLADNWIPKHTYLRFLFVLLPTLFLLPLTYTAVKNLGQSRQQSLHTRNILDNLDSIFSRIQSMETGQRGYLLTGDETYLTPYLKAQDELNKTCFRTEVLLHDNPVQLRNMNRLRHLIAVKTGELESTINVRRTHGLKNALAIVTTNEGQQLMDDIRALMQGMRELESAALEERRNHYTFYVYLLGVLLGIYIFFLFAVLWLLLQQINIAKKMQSALQKSHDVLEEKIAERTHDLQAKTDELARSNMELEQFAYIASHDLQEPLRKIGIYSELLEQKLIPTIDSEGEHFLSVIRRNATRMRQLIQDVLTFSRINKFDPPKSIIDLNTIGQDVLDDLEVLIQEHNADVVFHPLPNNISANPSQIHQLLQNLIGNAIKFHGSERPRVEVSAEQQDDEWIVSIRDNGIGIEERFSARIFEAFRRLHSRDKYPGTGIGLAICKKIVEGYGGRIWATSVVGEGSTFSFSLPKPVSSDTRPENLVTLGGSQ